MKLKTALFHSGNIKVTGDFREWPTACSVCPKLMAKIVMYPVYSLTEYSDITHQMASW